MPVLDPAALIENRVTAIRRFHTVAGAPRAELDVSGGVDSAVMLGLLSKAIGPENVTAIWIGIDSSQASRDRAREAAQAFGVKLIEYDGTNLFHHLVEELSDAMNDASGDPNGQALYDIHRLIERDPTVLGSIRSTLRAPIGRAVNRLAGGGIRHGTGNEDEDRILRFYQKGGDGEVDTNPIAMLSKGEVFQLARALRVPHSILTARPSPDLWGQGEAHNDEDEIAAYLDLKDCGHTMYSYIDMATGEYTHVGLVERLSRFCDYKFPMGSRDYGNDRTYGARLFDPQATTDTVETFAEHSDGNPALRGIGDDLARRLLLGAQRVERSTRHKLNPNIPMLGNRDDLVKVGILANDLPRL